MNWDYVLLPICFAMMAFSGWGIGTRLGNALFEAGRKYERLSESQD